MTISLPSPAPDVIKSKLSVAALGKILHNKDSKYSLPERFRVLFTLCALDSDEAVDIIGATFSDPSALLKHELAYVLGQMGRPYANGILVSVLEDLSQETIVRHEAAEALGAIGSAESLPILQKYLNDEAIAVRETCEIAIDLISKGERQKSEQSTTTTDLVFGSVDPAPALSGKKSIKELEEQLMDTSLNLYTRYKAMFALRNKGTTEAVIALSNGFKDESALFRHEIAYVFGQLQHTASIPALCEVLKNVEEAAMVRHECAEALGSIATPECLAILKEFDNDPETIVRESCLIARDMYEYENSNELHFVSLDTVEQ